jgi:dTDP-4-dehydrorhamnose reductase
LSRYEIGRKVALLAGMNPELIRPRDSYSPAAGAARPKDVSLDNRKARSHLHTCFPDFDPALAQLLANQSDLDESCSNAFAKDAARTDFSPSIS